MLNSCVFLLNNEDDIKVFKQMPVCVIPLHKVFIHFSLEEIGLNISNFGGEILNFCYSNNMQETCERPFSQHGENYIYEIHLIKMFDEVKGFRGIIVHVNDITARKKTEQNIIESRQKAEEANQAKSDFLASMSHEIRTPLNGVVGMTNLLFMTDLTEEQQSYVSVLQSSANNLMGILNNILDISKAEAGKLELEQISIPIRTLLEDVISVYRFTAAEKRISLLLEMDSEIPEQIIGDPVRMKQILSNLITNALKFTKAGYVKLDIKLLQRNENIVVLEFNVVDTGIGIHEDKIDHLFAIYHQEDASITRNFGGTGLGLAISKNLVELMKGTIEVESTYQKGSRFFFQIPFLIDQKDMPENKVQHFHKDQDSNDLLDGRKILIAEDDMVSRTFIQSLFKGRNVKLFIAENGEQAVRLFELERPDVILMDIQMPLKDGFTATREIREIERNSYGHVPIIAVTAFANTGFREKTLEAGMDDYMTKPFQISYLFVKLISWLVR